MPPVDRRRDRGTPGLPVRARRRLPVVGAVVVLAAFGGAIWYAYTMGKSAMVDSEVPLITARTDPLRTEPDDPGGMQVPFRDKLVYEQLLSDAPPPSPKDATLLPRPEEPVDRPPPMPAEPEAPPVPSEGVTVSPLPRPEERTPAPAPEERPAEALPVPTPAPTPAQPPAPPTQPAETAPPAQPAETARAPQPSRGGGYRVQIASLRSEAEARTAWERARKANSDLLGRLEASYERVDLGSRGVYHRVQAGPLPEKTLADMLCSQLKARNVGCIVVAP
ncbi:cell division septation protein DedD [Constrictibacter sp. MBR-5]|jgi:cell division septation protein DedD|uniref:SPOR domain-containing protein n=1 Tax=Constrictibacter sp. MBR-5 TaxID=3156467 RepID=UPI003399FD82